VKGKNAKSFAKSGKVRHLIENLRLILITGVKVKRIIEASELK